MEGQFRVREQPPRIAISITREEAEELLRVVTPGTSLHNDLTKMAKRRGWLEGENSGVGSADGVRHDISH